MKAAQYGPLSFSSNLMKKNYSLGLFIFHRDLRLEDNMGLNKALEECAAVIPCFIFDPIQVSNRNEYKSDNAIQFMITSLKELAQHLKKKKGSLYLFHGDTKKIVKKLFKDVSINAVYSNHDYTPFSLKRDEAIKKLCIQHEIDYIQTSDALLTQPNEVVTTSGTPYQVFTPFFKKARRRKIPQPVTKKGPHFYTKKIPGSAKNSTYKKILKKENKDILVKGGRKEALNILKKLSDFKDYTKTRDYPAIPTTHLSAHNKFGTVSIREVFHAIQDTLGSTHSLIQQLFWRDFFYHVAYNSPFVFGQAYHKKFNKLKWDTNKKAFKAWCEGKTGFPIVDAGMRQLNTIGWMHNRTRMIVGSFLTKDLHITWLWGEKYFAQNLVDYDPCVNNGNWQWTASTGCDAQPYFRIFNPWTQQKKFDPECIYIKEWIPELKNIDNKTIHSWYKSTEAIKNYPKPIVDHDKERKIALQRYRKV